MGQISDTLRIQIITVLRVYQHLADLYASGAPASRQQLCEHATAIEIEEEVKILLAWIPCDLEDYQKLFSDRIAHRIHHPALYSSHPLESKNLVAALYAQLALLLLDNPQLEACNVLRAQVKPTEDNLPPWPYVEKMLASALHKTQTIFPVYQWLSHLPEVYYYAFLSWIPVHEMERWHRALLDADKAEGEDHAEIQRELAAAGGLSESQVMVYQFAFIRLRQKFKSIYDPDDFEQVFESSYRVHSILQSALTKQAMTKSELAALAFLDYTATADYIKRAIKPEERLSLAKEMQPDFASGYIGDAYLILMHYADCISFLVSEDERKLFAKHVIGVYLNSIAYFENKEARSNFARDFLINYAKVVISLDIMLYFQLFERLITKDQLEVAAHYFLLGQGCFSPHWNYTLSQLNGSQKNKLVHRFLSQSNQDLVKQISPQGLFELLSFYEKPKLDQLLSVKDDKGVCLFEKLAKSDDHLAALFRCLGLASEFDLLKKAPYALVVSTKTESYFSRFLSSIPRDQLLAFIIEPQYENWSSPAYSVLHGLLENFSSFKTVILQLTPEERQLALTVIDKAGATLYHYAIRENNKVLCDYLDQVLTPENRLRLLATKTRKLKTVSASARDLNQLAWLFKDDPKEKWLPGLIDNPQGRRCAPPHHKTLAALLDSYTDDVFLKALTLLKDPLAPGVVYHLVRERFLKVLPENCLHFSTRVTINNVAQVFSMEALYPLLHDQLGGRTLLSHLLLQIESLRQELQSREPDAFDHYLMMRYLLAVALKPRQGLFGLFARALAPDPLTLQLSDTLDRCASFEEAAVSIRGYIQRSHDPLAKELAKLYPMTQPGVVSGPPLLTPPAARVMN